MAQQGEDVYATLLLNDTYLPGALVLAHSLRDAGTSKKLAVLVTLDTVSTEVVTELKNTFDYVLPVPRIKNEAAPGNLSLMNRPDLHSAFTKINLWKQLQFRKIVYIDADVVAYRAPDELFDLPHAFAAAPDIGWPDLFNTGVMVVTPDLGEYRALADKAQRGISFDGADQGLLNMHFGNSSNNNNNNYHRLPFTYNVTPSAHYQYLPAYRHFQSSINMVHFIGPNKPWFQGRAASTGSGSGAYDEMVGQWWAVYDRHYGAAASSAPSDLVRYFVKGEYNPTVTYKLTAHGPLDLGRSTYGQHSETLPPPLPPSLSFFRHNDSEQSPSPSPSYPPSHHDLQDQCQDPYHHGEQGQDSREHAQAEHAPPPTFPLPSHAMPRDNTNDASTHTATREDQDQSAGWDAQWQPPPAGARPEAMNFPQAHYEMSRDATPFKSPNDMGGGGTDRKVPSIFPWEANQPPPTRVFADSSPSPTPASASGYTGQSQSGHGTPTESSSFQERGAEKYVSLGSTASVELGTEPSTPTNAPASRQPTSSDPWANFPRTNAWDGIPQIERYVDTFQKQHRRAGSRGQAPVPASVPGSESSSRVTDFPSEVERPSLPVTPAPIHRSTTTQGDAEDGDGADGASTYRQLPAARGVPQQADWDPATQLQKLAIEQPRQLLAKLGLGLEDGLGEDGQGHGQEHGQGHGEEAAAASAYDAQPHVMSPKPVKPGGLEASTVLLGIYDQTSVDSSATNNNNDNDSTTAAPPETAKILQPAYLGPGVAFEKDEGLPAHSQTTALPSEEELDVLDT